MRVAALYDVHGNLPALEAVLAEADASGVDALVCGGDVVWGPDPGGCVELLRAAGARFLRGNCEREVLSGVGSDADEWCLARLTPAQRELVAAWPETLWLEIDGLGETLFCHGSPRSDTEMLTEATPDDVVAEIVAGVDAGVVVCGHTHHQFDRRVAGVRLVNAGSVGLPYEGAPGAFWTLLGPGVEPRRTEYDVEAALLGLVASGFPPGERLFVPALRGLTPKADAVAFFESRRGT